MKDGYTNKCKECTKSDNKNNRNKKIDYYKEYDKSRANLKHRIEARKEYQKTDNYKKNHYKNNLKYTKANRIKQRARRKVQYYLSKGELSKKPCEVCGNIKSEAHHADYTKPLDIIWLCDKHHKKLHIRIKKHGE